MSADASPAAADLRVEPMGDQALLAVLGDRINPGVNDRVHRLAGLIREASVPGVTDLVPAYATLAVHYDPGHGCSSRSAGNWRGCGRAARRRACRSRAGSRSRSATAGSSAPTSRKWPAAAA